jgi:hypothetical protein
MIRRCSPLLAVALLLVVTACASRSGAPRGSANRNTLSAEEMEKAGYPDVFTTVQSLRPQWLQKRGATSFRGTENIKVYLDGQLLGGPENLHQITTRSIATIEYFDGIKASERWGLDHGQGAIVVSTRRDAMRL